MKLHQATFFDGGRRLQMTESIERLIERGATFVVNHSGGKDSQAMFTHLRQHIPERQLVAVHAELPEVDWDGIVPHIKATIGAVPLHLCRARRTLLQMVEERRMFPSPKLRQCTSDLKRGPIEKTIRGLGVKLIVNCIGIRAEESSRRAHLETFKLNERNSKAGREWYDWLPIHDWPLAQVFRRIADEGQKPHWAYAAGMSRLSCCFCIMASRSDLTTAARLKPDLYRRYVELERSTGQVMLMPGKTNGRQTLEQITGVAA
jgi:DNA sulfur modification protein DndC